MIHLYTVEDEPATTVMITVRDLAESSELHCSILAGMAGADNEITWAHVNEMLDPTAWLVGGELLMSTGMALRPEPNEQVAYLRRLAAKKVAGVALGDRKINKLDVAPLTDAFFATANDLELPVVLVSGGTPFIAIIQRVAVANRDMLHHRLTRRLSVYESVHDVVRTQPSIDALLTRLTDISGYEIWVLARSGKPFFSAAGPPPFKIEVAEIQRMLVEDDLLRTPRRIELGTNDQSIFVVPILARHQPAGLLVARPLDGDQADSLILHHVSAIISLLAADHLRERERLRREGAEALARLLTAAESGQPATVGELFPRKKSARYCFVSIALEGSTGWDSLHNELIEHGFTHTITRRSGRAAAIVELEEGVTIDDLVNVWAALMPGSVAGVSSELPRDADVIGARRQARWALQCAAANDAAVEHYAAARPPGWLQPDTSGLELLIESLLGPLHEYDVRTGSDLHRTLEVFLQEDRSWKNAAERLYIHRQTLIHRIKRIEQLTGRHLHSTDDVCDLWLALKAERTLAGATDSPA